jgi:alpha-L-arabinofuranosidase
LERAGEEIAFICPHHYTPDFAICDQDFLNLGRMIRGTPGCNHVKIAVTEWNISGGAWGLLRGKFLTLETALLNARYLNLLMKHSDKVEIACRSNLANSFGSGIIETIPSGLLKRPSYYVMKLYAEHVKPVPLQVEKAPEGLDTIACASDDGKAIAVFIVNSKGEPMEVSPTAAAISGEANLKALAVCDSLDARQPDVMNHWSAPKRVDLVELPVVQRMVKLPAYSASVIEIETSK